MVHCFLAKIALVLKDGQHDAKLFPEVPERPKEDLTNETHTTLWANEWKLFYIIKLMDIWINLNRKSQHDLFLGFFFEEKFCLTNLFNFSEEAIKNVDKDYPFDMVYLYFQKAFSNVPHPKTLK